MKMNEFSNGKVYHYLSHFSLVPSYNIINQRFIDVHPSLPTWALLHHSDSFLAFLSSFPSSFLRSFPPSFLPSCSFLSLPPSLIFLPSFLPSHSHSHSFLPHSIPTHLPETQVGTGTGKVLKVPIEVSTGIFSLASRNRIRRSISIAEIFVITPIITPHNFINSSIRILFVHQRMNVLLLLL